MEVDNFSLWVNEALHKICENTGFHWTVFSRIREKQVSENPSICIVYAVVVEYTEWS